MTQALLDSFRLCRYYPWCLQCVVPSVVPFLRYCSPRGRSTHLQKLVAEILKRPPRMTCRDVCSLLQGFGWTQRPQKGTSHLVFTKKGELPVTVPLIKGRWVRDVYLAEIRKHLRLEEEN
ncbi:MAG: type II toxin-antitoxin system HicA family toxin [Sphingomonadaceae bacterium]